MIRHGSVKLGGFLVGLLLVLPAWSRTTGDAPTTEGAPAPSAATAAPAPVPAKAPAEAPAKAPVAAKAAAKAPPPAATADLHKVSPYRPTKLSGKAQNYYAATWGIDALKVSSTSSGNLIRFSYRVADPSRAKILVDRSATPYLYGQRSRALLQVPVMEKVGPLRQAEGLEAGRDYWMVFSNKGQLVKRGDRVNVTVGTFHADGLIVE